METMQIGPSELAIRAATPRVSVFEYSAPPSTPGPTPHVHPGLDELYLVLAGTLTVETDGRVETVGTGETVRVDGSLPHTFSNESNAPLRLLTVCAPGGFEDYYRMLAAGRRDEAVAFASERFGYAVADPAASCAR
jgi:mannose-6-phosphate isomerase-like protein (cupin superfamily)